MNLLDDIATLARRPDVPTAAVVTVVAVTTAAGSAVTVDVDALGQTVAGIPCSAAYPSPAEGDVVLVMKLGSAWHVAYALNRPPAGGGGVGVNLVSNSGFELDAVGTIQPSGWRRLVLNGGGVAMVVGDDSHSGSQAYQTTFDVNKDSYLALASPIPVDPGRQVRIGVWVKQLAGFQFGETARLEVWPTADPDLSIRPSGSSTLFTVSTPPGVWRFIELPYTQLAGKAWLTVALVCSGFNATQFTGNAVLWDDVSIRLVN